MEPLLPDHERNNEVTDSQNKINPKFAREFFNFLKNDPIFKDLDFNCLLSSHDYEKDLTVIVENFYKS